MVLKSWFFHPEVFLLPAQKKKDESTHNLPIEMGFIDKLGEMYKIRKILRDLKQEMEHSNGLSTGYARNEGKFIADQIMHFRSTYLQSVIAPEIKELDLRPLWSYRRNFFFWKFHLNLPLNFVT